MKKAKEFTKMKKAKALLNEGNNIFTKDTIINYLTAKRWKNELVDTPEFQSLKMHFKCPSNNLVLSLVAGRYQYCHPKLNCRDYKLIEIGLLKNDVLVIVKKRNQFFINDGVEGYVDWNTFKRIVDFVDTLKLDEIEKCIL